MIAYVDELVILCLRRCCMSRGGFLKSTNKTCGHVSRMLGIIFKSTFLDFETMRNLLLMRSACGTWYFVDEDSFILGSIVGGLQGSV